MPRPSGSVNADTERKLGAIISHMRCEAETGGIIARDGHGFRLVWVSASPIDDIAAVIYGTDASEPSMSSRRNIAHKYLNLLAASGWAKRLAGNHAWILTAHAEGDDDG